MNYIVGKTPHYLGILTRYVLVVPMYIWLSVRDSTRGSGHVDV
jgi:hypothetical protein